MYQPLNLNHRCSSVTTCRPIRSLTKSTEKFHLKDPLWLCAGCLHAKCTRYEPQYEVGSSRSGSRHTHMPYRPIPHPIDPTSDLGSRVQENQLGQLVSESPLPSSSTFLLYTPAQLLAISHLLVDLGATNYLVPICGWRRNGARAVCVSENDTAIGRPCVAMINPIQPRCGAPGHQRRPCRPLNL
jgi:hypothetical protein